MCYDSACLSCHNQVLEFDPKQKKRKKRKGKKNNMNWDLNVLQQLLKTFLTCLGWSRRGVGAVGAVCSIRGVET